MNYPRRQQLRRLSRAGRAAVASATAGLLALAVARVGAVSLAGTLAIVALVLALYAHRWFVLAGRSRIGARSEDEVRRSLALLGTEGWRMQHSLSWRGRGDIDSVAIAPDRIAFAIEVKTSRYEQRNLAVVREQAAWLWRFRRGWCRGGVVPVLCVARSRGVQRWEDGVLVVSIDCLLPALRAANYPGSVGLPF